MRKFPFNGEHHRISSKLDKAFKSYGKPKTDRQKKSLVQLFLYLLYYQSTIYVDILPSLTYSILYRGRNIVCLHIVYLCCSKLQVKTYLISMQVCIFADSSHLTVSNFDPTGNRTHDLRGAISIGPRSLAKKQFSQAQNFQPLVEYLGG